MNTYPLIGIMITCMLSAGGCVWYLASKLATLTTQIAAVVGELRDFGEELREARKAQHDYAAAIAEQVHSQDTRLAVLERDVMQRRAR